MALLIRHEGLALKIYVDTVGKRTIGVGRNLDDVGISRAEALQLLDHDLDDRLAALTALFPWFAALDPVRQRVLIDMSFMGVKKLLGFTATLAAIERGDYLAAATGMLASKWAAQVKGRAIELALMMRTGLEMTVEAA